MTATREGVLFDLESKYLSAVYATDQALVKSLDGGETPELRMAFYDANAAESRARRELLKAHRAIVNVRP